MLERKIIEDQGVIPGVDFIIAATTLTPTQLCVRVSAAPATGAFAVTLANVSQCAGKFVSVFCLDADATNAITLQDADESEDWANITFNGPLDGVLLYSDGRKWWVVSTDVSHTGTTGS